MRDDGVYIVPISAAPDSLPDLDVVFVHGLSSNAREAWKNGNGDTWPFWLSQMFGTARVLLLNYPAPSFFSHRCSRLTIIERARNVSDLLSTQGIGDRPTIFICHSLGGIVVKEILRSCVETGCALGLATNTIGVIFIATPHSGSDLASWVGLLGSRLTADLAADSDYVLSLRDWFTNYAERSGIFVSAYYETQPYRGVIVVDRNSADPCCSGCSVVALDANHSDIAKPLSPSSDIFMRLRRDIQASKQKVDAMASSISSITDILLLPELTNRLYFDTVHFLNMWLSRTAKNGIIISSPCRGPKPCCIILSTDHVVLQLVMPLQQRFPDRFSVEHGMLGEFTVDATQPVMLYEELKADVERWVINLKTCIAVKQGERIFMVAAAHALDRYIELALGSAADKISESTLDKLYHEKAHKMAIPYKDNHKVDTLLTLKNQIYQNINEFKVSPFSWRNRVYGSRYSCRIDNIDFARDAVILCFDIGRKKNEGLEDWCRYNTVLTEDVWEARTPAVGDACTTPEEPGKLLKIDSVSETCVFPMRDKVTKLNDMMVLSGCDAKMGSSGAPVCEPDGKVIGMIVGRTRQGEAHKYLAVSLINVFTRSLMITAP
jgi:pimeloyl-ACP methyl ester carboxylesterase